MPQICVIYLYVYFAFNKTGFVMNLIMDGRKRLVDPKEEVKKLQDLVKKLEIQNQQLRNRQNRNTIVPKDSNINRDAIRMLSNRKERSLHEPKYFSNLAIRNRNRSTSPVKSEKRKSSTLEEISLINIDDMEMSEDESWLYTSPKGLPPEEKTLSPYMWLRRDVEDPCNKELQLAKKALLNKLDELSILTQNQGRSHSISRIQKPREIPVRKSCHFDQPHAVDSRTFTRSRKNRNTMDLPVIDPPDIADAADKDTSTEKSGDSSMEKSFSMCSVLTLTDVTEVQEIARMQEESLRQNFPVNKRHSVSSLSGRNFSISSRSSTSDVETQDIIIKTYNEGYPTSTSAAVLHTDQSSASEHSSPSDSPYSSSASLNMGSNTESTPHSIPSHATSHNGVKYLRQKTLGNSRLHQLGTSRSTSALPRSDSKILPPSQKFYREGSHSASSTPSRVRSQMTVTQNVQSTQDRSGTSSSHSSYTPVHTPSLSSHSGTRKPSALRPPSKIPSKPRSGIPVGLMSRQITSRQIVDDDNWSEGCY